MTDILPSNSNASSSPLGIPSDAYTEDYYVNYCQGHTEFNTTAGKKLPLRLKLPLHIAAPRAGMQILDVGCGRGELSIHLASAGALVWGIDYAQAALDLAAGLKQRLELVELCPRMCFARASGLELPFPEEFFDVVMMLDVVEHLYPSELTQTLSEIRRVLKPGGRIVIHTMPNLWYYHWGYPVFRAFQRVKGQRLPADPRDRWAYKEVHVNEQTPTLLSHTLKQSGFKAQVWLETTQTYPDERSMVIRFGMQALTKVYPFRWIFCNDIFAVGTKL